MAEPTDFLLSGASGYAGATMRDVIQQIESHTYLLNNSQASYQS